MSVILELWNLTREGFIIQLEGSEEDKRKLLSELKSLFPEKMFYIHLLKGGKENET